jgi:ABC-type multidrug transport system ATPase subunit
MVFNNRFVSNNHARLDLRGGNYWITDLGSTNGTWVNGQPVQSRPLNDGDIIRIGDQQGNSVGLVFRSGAGARPLGTIRLKTLTLTQLPDFAIGRDPNNQLHLDHPTVSRYHARVMQTAHGHQIHDLNSTNGTFVNGQLVRGAHPLQAGDVVQIGPFKLVYDLAGLTQYTPAGHYRLDAIGLKREVSLVGTLSQRRLLPLSQIWERHPEGTRGGEGQPTHKLILNNISLSIYPKEFVALVGGSGAGKSTLMNALSGFVPAQGQVLLNGDDLYANFAAYRSILGYVPQDDIIHRQLTVRSALTYAAQLRLPDAPSQEIEQRVDDVLAQVEMVEHADKQVRRLSGGQRKRVSIAVELLAEPGLFFLDEPTSGLDPGLEKKMMYTLRQLADGGRTIVLVTHATANINQCDHVAFVADGRLVYFGPPQEALPFFDANDFADIYTRLSQPIDPVNNPVPPQCQLYYQQAQAAHPHEPPSAAEVWTNCFQASSQYQQYVAGRRIQGGQRGVPASATHPPARQWFGQTHHKQASAFQQFQVLARRYLELIRRDFVSLAVLLAVMPLIGLLLLVMAKPDDLVGKNAQTIKTEIQQAIDDKLAGQDPDVPDEQFQASYTVAGAAQKLLFMLALAANLLGIFAAAYEIIKEEAIYRRERMVNLKILPYLLSKVAVLALFALLQCFLLLLVVRFRVTYPDAGILLPPALEMYVTLFLATLASLCLGLLISALVRSADTIIYVILLVLFVQILFAGAIFDLPAAARPISYLTTSRWTLEALGSTVDMETLKQQGVSCIEFEDEQTGNMMGESEDPCGEGQMKQAVDYAFNVDYSHTAGHLVTRWVVLVGFALAFGGLTFVTQKQKDVI